MSQSPDLLTTQPSSQESHLHPTVQAALGSLSLKIDEELTRYRRQRRVEQSRSAYPITGHSQARPSVDLIYVQATGGRTQPQAGPASENQSPDITSQPSALAAVEGNTEPETPDENLVVATKGTAPDGYLESSEELIKSLSEEETLKQPAKTPKENLLSPLGIGSMLLFLLASITFGYVVSNPSSLRHLGFKTSDETVDQNQTAATPTTSPAGKATERPLPTAPDLAGQEFSSLELENLSTLTPQRPNTPSPSVPPAPAANTLSQVTVVPAAPSAVPSPAVQGLDNLGSALLENPKPAQNPSRGTPLTPPPQTGSVQPATPAPTPQATQAATAQSQPDEFFYVVMDYNNDQSLEKARQVVADAYTRDFPNGVQIQLGAFNDAATAKTLVEELQKQGLPAKVYRP